MAKKGVVACRRGEAEGVWAGRIQAWRDSGQTQVRFCAERGLSVWVLRKWIVKRARGSSVVKCVPALLPIPITALRTAPQELVGGAREAALEIALPNGIRVRASGQVATVIARVLARALRC